MAAEIQTTSKKKNVRSRSAAETKTAARKSTKKSAAKKTAEATVKKTSVAKKTAKATVKKTSVAKRSAKAPAKKTRAAATVPAVEMFDLVPTDSVATVEETVAVTAPEIVPETTPESAYRPDPDEVAVAVLEAEPEPPAEDNKETCREPERDEPIVYDGVDDSIDRNETPAENQPQVTAADAAAPTNAEVLGDELQLVCFTLDDEEYGVDIQQVQEINRVSRVTTIPDAPAYVKGIIDLRGHVIPIVDLRLRLGYPARDNDKHTRVVVLDFDGHLIGLIVDAVTEVLRVSRAHIDKTPDLAASTDRECLEGLFQRDTKMILIINHRKILQF